MTLSFYLGYALRSLRRSGQRTWIAIICVAFGVMSLVAMQILAGIVTNTVLLNPISQLDGDLQISRPESFLDEAAIAQLDDMAADGTISAYSLYANAWSLMVRQPESGHVTFVMRGQGIDPAVFPLVGEIVLREPAGAVLADVLSTPGSVAVTRDIVNKTGLQVGDTVFVNLVLGSAPVELTIAGIVETLPDRQGSKLIYNLATAQLLTGREHPATGASLLTDTPVEAAAQLEAVGWHVTTPEALLERNRSVRDIFNIGAKGAGLLGLLVGGIGVANTMQVLLARRTQEIAILKTLGYRQRDLLALFGLETLLLGLVGSVAGIVAALLIATPIVGAFVSILAYLIEVDVNGWQLLGGVLTGTITTLIFGLFVITRSSTVRPAVLLNGRPSRLTWRDHLRSAALFLVMLLPFSLLCMLVMESIVTGLGVVALAIGGFIVLGLAMWLGLFIFVRLPLPLSAAVQLARRNLKRGQLRAVTAMIALFVGIFAIGFATQVIANASFYVNSRSLAQDGYNLMIVTGEAGQAAVDDLLSTQEITGVFHRYLAPLTGAYVTSLDGASQPVHSLVLEGRLPGDPLVDLVIHGSTFGTVEGGAYLPIVMQSDALSTAIRGNTATITLAAEGRAPHTLPLAGFYEPISSGELAPQPSGVIVTDDMLREIASSAMSVQVMAEVPEARLAVVTETLAQARTQDIVINTADLNEMFNLQLYNLFIFAVSIAGLSLVAGAVLIANSVGLAMVERKREIGLLKAVGFGSSQVLRTTLIEHGLLGILAGMSGTAAAAVMVAVMNAMQSGAELTFQVLPSLIVIAFAITLILLSAALVAWRPVRVRPIAVLRDE